MIVVELSCVEAWLAISEMIDGMLEPEMQARMSLHLAHCAHCTAVYDGTSNAVRLIGDERAFELPQGFAERLFQRLSLEFCAG